MDEQAKVEERPHIGSMDEVRKLLDGVETAMLVTHAPDGRLHARPMVMQDPALVPDADLWFVTADHTPKADEIREDHQVAVCCQRPDGAFVSISALAHIDDNPTEVQRLWKPEWRLWLAEEGTDARIAILKLSIERTEHWPAAGGRVQIVYV